jgi:hypothetical protein
MARRLETYLYRNATSLEAYKDSTYNLKQRIQQVVADVSQKLQEKRDDIYCSSSKNDDSELSKPIRHEQQQLLLLHHSSKCVHKECKEYTTCRETKNLWKHLGKCKARECCVEQCFSSRQLLSHHIRCKDTFCLVCGPVRKSIAQVSTAAANSEPSALTRE